MSIELGAHNVVSFAVNTGVGNALVVTVYVPAADVHPAADVAVTVYVVDPAGGVTVILDPVPPVDQLYDAAGPKILTA